MELSEPIDYEDFVKKNQSLLEGVSQKDLVNFPENDVTVTTLPRKFRTVDIPVPGPVKYAFHCVMHHSLHVFASMPTMQAL